MNISQTLTKENFWNEMMEKYPNAAKKFCDWIDEYKKAVSWATLFNAEVSYTQKATGGFNVITTTAPKYHDLPYAMQLGIWIEYMCQRGGCQWEIENMFDFDLAKDIEGTFKNLLEEEAIEENE